jgi:cytochrome c biogenesis protein CcmG/thiol:disulfide interchange protein DsbE
VLLNFWASWCVPCAAEAADLEALWRDYQDEGLVVLGLAYTDTEPAARAYLARHGITYPNAPDRQAMVSRSYHIAGVPETFLIDPAGRLVPLEIGGEALPKLVGPLTPDGPLTATSLRRQLDALLGRESG